MNRPFRGKPRGRGRGRSFTRTPNTSEEEPIAKAPTHIADVVPERSKPPTITHTPLSNDPMLSDKIFDGKGLTFLPAAPAKKHYPSFFAFSQIVTGVYDSITGDERDFKRSVTPAEFAYYANQHLVARLIAIRADQGQASKIELDFLGLMRHNQYPVPGVINEYLRGIGEFTTTQDSLYHTHIPSYEPQFYKDAYIDGWGKFSSETLVSWMNYPHPYIHALRIQMDIQYSDVPTMDPNWNLPDHLRPDPVVIPATGLTQQITHDPGTPTVNLPGWAPAQRIENEQKVLLSQAGITASDFGECNPMHLFHNPALMRIIAGRLNSTKFRLSPGPHLFRVGSVANQIIVIPQDEPVHRVSIYKHYLTFNNIRGTSYASISDTFTWAGLLAAYNIEFRMNGNHALWSPYSWDNYTHVPDSWKQVVNTLINQRSHELLLTSVFDTVEYIHNSLVSRTSETTKQT